MKFTRVLGEVVEEGNNKLMQVAGFAPPLFEKGTRITKDPDPEYDHTARVLDTCMDYARRSINMWRYAAIAGSVSTVLASGGWYLQAQKASDTVHWLPYDRLGVVGPEFVAVDKQPPDAVKVTFMQDWLLHAFRRSDDKNVRNDDKEWLRLRIADQATTFWNTWSVANNADPNVYRVVDDVRIFPTVTADVYRATWTNQNWKDGRREVVRMSGEFKLDHKVTKTNLVGLRVVRAAFGSVEGEK